MHFALYRGFLEAEVDPRIKYSLEKDQMSLPCAAVETKQTDKILAAFECLAFPI